VKRHITILTLIYFVAACAGAVPTEKEIRADNSKSRAAQLMRIAETTRQGGDLKSALALFQRAHAMEPEQVAPLLAIGETAQALNLYNEAVRAYDDVLQKNQNTPEALLGAGKALISLDRPLLASDHYRKLISLAPRDYRGYNGLGVSMDLQGLHADAQVQYHQGLEIAPGTLSLKKNLALSLSFEGKHDQAIAILAPYVDDPLSDAKLRQNLALIYGLSGDMENAAKLAARDLDPRSVKNNLAFYERLRSSTGREKAKSVYTGNGS